MPDSSSNVPPPADWKGHAPISKRSVDYGRSDLAQWRRAFHQHLRCLRKVALRLGHIPTTNVRWQLTTDALKALLNGQREWISILDDDFRLDLHQKGVDMRIGWILCGQRCERTYTSISMASGVYAESPGSSCYIRRWLHSEPSQRGCGKVNVISRLLALTVT